VQRGNHRGTRRKSVVDDDHHSSRRVERRSFRGVLSAALADRLEFGGGLSLHITISRAGLAGIFCTVDPSRFIDRTDGELRISGRMEHFIGALASISPASARS